MIRVMQTRWAAIGAAVAVTLGAGGVSLTQAAVGADAKPVYVSLAQPCRLVDTRPATQIGDKGTPIGAGAANAYEIQVTGGSGACTTESGLAIPAEAVGVSLNVTAIAPAAPTTGRSYFTVYPSDAELPGTSNLNFLDGGAPTPNKVDVGLSADGMITIFNNEGTAHAAVDVFGYYVDHDHDDRYYTEGEVDAALADKADAGDVYTKTEVDAAVAGLLSNVVTRDALLDLSTGTTADVFCNAGEVAVGGSVNIIPDGTGTVTTSRPVGNVFGDSPDNGTAFIGWRGVSNSGAGLLVVHVFCAS